MLTLYKKVIVTCMNFSLYRIDLEVLGTSINADQNPEAKVQIEKIRTLTVSIHQVEVSCGFMLLLSPYTPYF